MSQLSYACYGFAKVPIPICYGFAMVFFFFWDSSEANFTPEFKILKPQRWMIEQQSNTGKYQEE